LKHLVYVFHEIFIVSSYLAMTSKESISSRISDCARDYHLNTVARRDNRKRV